MSGEFRIVLSAATPTCSLLIRFAESPSSIQQLSWQLCRLLPNDFWIRVETRSKSHFLRLARG